MINFENKKLAAFLTVSITALAIFSIIWLWTDIDNKLNASENTITVSATSEVYAQPDLALTSVGVVSEAKTVLKAMQYNTEKMNAIIAFIKNQGVEDKDLKTVNFNISPRYEWDEQWRNRILAGYEVSQSLQVKIRDLAKIGDIIQGATTAGANDVGSLQFTIDNEDALREEARNKAIQEAKENAKILASQLGVRLAKMINFSENGLTPVPYYSVALKEATGMGGGATPDIQTGENKISVTVALTYQIK